MGTSDGSVIGLTKVVDHGNPALRWNLVILGDGYQQAQLTQFHGDVQNFVDTMYQTPPYGELWGGINVYRIDVASTDSGADDPAACGGTGATASTYFDASFCHNGIQRLLEVNTTTVNNVVNAQFPQAHMIMVIVNTTEYGGSGGSMATFSLAADAEEIGLHETGHTAFGLADEYESYAGCPSTDPPGTHDHYTGSEPGQPNISKDYNAIAKWHDLQVPMQMPITSNKDCTKCDPQPNPQQASTVGAYEGAGYYHCGLYRPQFTCRMRALGNPYCAVCQRVIRQTLAPYVIPGNVSGVPGLHSWELVIPMAAGGLGYYSRDDVAPGMPWSDPFVFGTNVGPFHAATIADGEIVAVVGGQLVQYQRDGRPSVLWDGPTAVGNQIVSGNPVIFKTIFNLVDRQEQLIVPLASGGLAHFWGDNFEAMAWNGPAIFGAELGQIDAVTGIQSTFHDPAGGYIPANLEVVVRAGGQLYHYWRDAGPAFHWNGPFPIAQELLVWGNPVLVQGPFGVLEKNFELVVPLANGGIAHYWRDNETAGFPWRDPTVFGTDIGRFDTLAMAIGDYTTSPAQQNTIQVIARWQEQLLFYYRDADASSQWTLL
jgi:hypothetical protein